MDKNYRKRAKLYSQNVRARYQRDSREEKFKQRRFNNPLRVFIEYKYPTIFKEYSELYQQLLIEYPHRKNLERTTLFRQLLEQESPPEVQDDIIKQAFKAAFGDQELPSQELPSQELPSQELPSLELPSLELPSQELPSQELPLLELPSQELPSQELPSQELPPQELPSLEQGPSQLYRDVDELLNELAANEDIGDILDQEGTTEDEGIGLNLEDEIFHDIQPLTMP